MAYTLKTSGIATQLVMCLAVDSNGTITEFVSVRDSTAVDANKTLGTGVAAGVSTSTWKGTSRGYFPTFDASFDYFGVKFASGSRPGLVTNGSFSFFAAMAGMSTGQGTPGIVEWFSNNSPLVQRTGGSGALQNALASASATTSMPTDASTKFSAGFSYNNSTGTAFYYGLESGSLAADGTSATAGFGSGSAINIFGVGGLVGGGSQPGNWHVVALFNPALTLTDMQSLHNDWFGTLFDAPATDTLMGQAWL